MPRKYIPVVPKENIFTAEDFLNMEFPQPIRPQRTVRSWFFFGVARALLQHIPARKREALGIDIIRLERAHRYLPKDYSEKQLLHATAKRLGGVRLPHGMSPRHDDHALALHAAMVEEYLTNHQYPFSARAHAHVLVWLKYHLPSLLKALSQVSCRCAQVTSLPSDEELKNARTGWTHDLTRGKITYKIVAYHHDKSSPSSVYKILNSSGPKEIWCEKGPQSVSDQRTHRALEIFSLE